MNELNNLIKAKEIRKEDTFEFRSDMDVLPIKEEIDYEYKSSNNNMHACGCDILKSMLLGSVEIIKENRT